MIHSTRKTSLCLSILFLTSHMFAATQLEQRLGELKISLDALKAKLSTPVAVITQPPPPPERTIEDIEKEKRAREQAPTPPSRVQAQPAAPRPASTAASQVETVEIELPKIETIQSVKVTNYAQLRFLFDAAKLKKPREQLIEIISILKGLAAKAEQQRPTPQQQKDLLPIIKEMLNISPLGISLAIDFLRTSGFSQEDLYSLEAINFENLVVRLENGIPLHKGRLPFGLRYDLDEAFRYPELIQQEMDTAKRSQTPAAQEFVKKMDELYQRLLALLRKHKNTLPDLPVETFERKLGKELVYCGLNYDEEKQVYKSIFEHLKELSEGVDAYKKPEATPALQEFVRKDITDALNKIVRLYMLNPEDKEGCCPWCLTQDLNEYYRNQQSGKLYVNPLEVTNKLMNFWNSISSEYPELTQKSIRNIKILNDIIQPHIRQSIDSEEQVKAIKQQITSRYNWKP